MPKRSIKDIPLNKVRTDGGTQARIGLNGDTVDEYAEYILARVGNPGIGEPMPPAIVFEDEDGAYWLGDGFHRHAAYQLAGLEEMPCDVRKGDRRAAVLFACGANAAHGLRRTSADKRQAVKILMADPEWAQWSDACIARACKVGREMVACVRQSLACRPAGDGALPQQTTERKYIDKHGNVSTMNVSSMKSEKNKRQELIDAVPAGGYYPNTDPDAAIDATDYGPPENIEPAAPSTQSAAGTANKARRRQYDPAKTIEDGRGTPVPDHLREYFATSAFDDVREPIDQLLELLNPNKIVAPVVSRMPPFGHLRAAQLVNQLEAAHEELIKAIQTLEAGRPFAICPKCQGACCLDCENRGVVPGWKWEELTKRQRS